MKIFTIKTECVYSDTVEVEAENAEEAKRLAHESADYDYDGWLDATVINVSDEE